MLAVTDSTRIEAVLVAIRQQILKVNYYIGRTRHQRNGDTRQRLSKTNRIDLEIVQFVVTVYADMVVELAGLLKCPIVWHGGSVAAATQQIDLDQMHFAFKHLALFPQVLAAPDAP